MGETNISGGDVKTLAEKKGLTPKQTPTHTQEQVDALVTKAKSDAGTDVGRLEAELNRLTGVANAALTRLRENAEAQLKAEEEAAQEDPDKLRDIRRRRADAQRTADLDELKRTLDEREAGLKTQTQEIRQHRAERLSEKYDVSSETLLKYGGDSKEGMEELAKSYGEKTEAGETKKRMKEPPDRGTTKGGAPSQTLEQLLSADVKKMTYQKRLEHKTALAEALKASGGVT